MKAGRILDHYLLLYHVQSTPESSAFLWCLFRNIFCLPNCFLRFLPLPAGGRWEPPRPRFHPLGLYALRLPLFLPSGPYAFRLPPFLLSGPYASRQPYFPKPVRQLPPLRKRPQQKRTPRLPAPPTG